MNESDNLGVDLVKILYGNTSLNYDACAINLVEIFEHIKARVPQFNDLSVSIISNIEV